LIMVDLPAPFSPTMATVLPAAAPPSADPEARPPSAA
jgi:hypothetical protein